MATKRKDEGSEGKASEVRAEGEKASSSVQAPVAEGVAPDRMVAEGAPVHPADALAAEGEDTTPDERTAPPARRSAAEAAARRMVAEGAPLHPDASTAAGEAPDGGDSAADDIEDEPPFPLRTHFHTWLHGSTAPAALQLLPVEPRRAWVWWRLDEAQRNAVKSEALHLEILDAAGNRLQLHRVEGPEGEWFLAVDAWRARLSARVGAMDGDALVPVLSTGPVEMPPERAGDAPVRWTDTARRAKTVRGIPAEYAGGDIPVVVAADGTLLQVGGEVKPGDLPSSVHVRRLRPGPVSLPSPTSSATGRPSPAGPGDAGA